MPPHVLFNPILIDNFKYGKECIKPVHTLLLSHSFHIYILYFITMSFTFKN